jgi:hypothetical protein
VIITEAKMMNKKLEQAKKRVADAMKEINEANHIVFNLVPIPVRENDGCTFELWHCWGSEGAFVIVEYLQIYLDEAPSVITYIQEKGTKWDSMKEEITARLNPK